MFRIRSHVQGAAAERAQKGLEELLHIQGQQGGLKEIPLVQGKRNPSKMVGVERASEGRHTETIITEN